jgi:hypothetical protein
MIRYKSAAFVQILTADGSLRSISSIGDKIIRYRSAAFV